MGEGIGEGTAGEQHSYSEDRVATAGSGAQCAKLSADGGMKSRIFAIDNSI
jgi:hypothetical protein